MSISPLALLAKKTIDAAWLHGTAYDLSSQAAFALESAQLLQSPETAKAHEQALDDLTGAQLARWEEEQDNARLRLALQSAQRDRRELRARVAELEAERHTTNEALSDAAEALRAERVSFAERARRESNPARRQAWRMLARVEESERVFDALLTPEARESADRLTQLLAPTQVLREVPDGEHAASVRHDYRVGRDLPELGGA